MIINALTGPEIQTLQGAIATVGKPDVPAVVTYLEYIGEDQLAQHISRWNDLMLSEWVPDFDNPEIRFN